MTRENILRREVIHIPTGRNGAVIGNMTATHPILAIGDMTAIHVMTATQDTPLTYAPTAGETAIPKLTAPCAALGGTTPTTIFPTAATASAIAALNANAPA